MKTTLSRRQFIKAGALTLLGNGGCSGRWQSHTKSSGRLSRIKKDHHGHDPMPSTVGEVDHAQQWIQPERHSHRFRLWEVSTLENGQTLREYRIVAVNRNIEVAPGIEYPAWTYNARIPGPTIRCTEGDRIRVHFTNGSSHPHTIHFHGFHSAEMDGVPGAGPGLIQPGESFTYEFDAEPFGLHLYHCHAFPLARHIAKGLYGAFIIDPQGRPAGGRP